MSLPVLMVVASEDDGGMGRVVYLLASRLAAFGVDVRVAVHREAPLTGWLRGAGVPYAVVPDLLETPTRPLADGRRGAAAVLASLARLPRAVRQIQSLAADHRARVIYSHNTWGHYVAALAARAQSGRSLTGSVVPVWHIHNDHSQPATRVADRLAARAGRVRAIATVSASIARPFAGLPCEIHVIRNGIEPDRIEAAAASPLLRARLGLDRTPVIVGYSGRLAAHKGIGPLLEAARLAVAQVPELHVVILGGTPRHARHDVVAALQAQVDAWGCGRSIHLLGHVDQVERYLADLDIAVVPSTCEDGCPLAAIEALSLGVPVIGTAVGGIPEIVRDGIDGVLVPAGDAAALASAIVALARDPDRRRRLAVEARAARERFSALDMTRKVADMLHRAAPGAPSLSAPTSGSPPR